jgi:hypothetical protein
MQDADHDPSINETSTTPKPEGGEYKTKNNITMDAIDIFLLSINPGYQKVEGSEIKESSLETLPPPPIHLPPKRNIVMTIYQG